MTADGWGESALTQIVVALIALVSGSVAAWLALRGKREEVQESKYRALVEGQGAWMDRMEARLAKVEESNATLHALYRREEEHKQMLRLALRRAVESIRQLTEWASGPRTAPEPVIDLGELEDVLARTELPTARLPPEE